MPKLRKVLPPRVEKNVKPSLNWMWNYPNIRWMNRVLRIAWPKKRNFQSKTLTIFIVYNGVVHPEFLPEVSEVNRIVNNSVIWVLWDIYVTQFVKRFIDLLGNNSWILYSNLWIFDQIHKEYYDWWSFEIILARMFIISRTDFIELYVTTRNQLNIG